MKLKTFRFANRKKSCDTGLKLKTVSAVGNYPNQRPSLLNPKKYERTEKRKKVFHNDHWPHYLLICYLPFLISHFHFPIPHSPFLIPHSRFSIPRLSNSHVMSVAETLALLAIPFLRKLCSHIATRLRVVSNFGDGDLWGRRNTHTRARKFRVRACVYFARHTIATTKIRDYSQSTSLQLLTVSYLLNREIQIF